MGNAWKAALLSGLVAPGLGQIVLKRYLRGVAFLFAILVALVVLVVKAVSQAMTILEQIEAKGLALDLDTISRAVNQSTTAPNSLVYNAALFSLIVLWIFGVIDAYRIGRQMDLAQQASRLSSSQPE